MAMRRQSSIRLSLLVLLALAAVLSAESAAKDLHPSNTTQVVRPAPGGAAIIPTSVAPASQKAAEEGGGTGGEGGGGGGGGGGSPGEAAAAVSGHGVALDGHLKQNAGYLGASLSQTPCEAGHPCRPHEWCSPSRQVCRPCKDVEPWCNHTDLIRQKYPACEPYCWESKLKNMTKACQTMEQSMQQKLQDKEGALANLTKTMAREKEKLYLIRSELEKERKTQGEKDTIITVLVCCLVFTSLWAAAVIIFQCYRHHQRQDAVQETPASAESLNPLLTTEEVKAPVQDNTKDSGEFCANNGNPGLRLPGDSAVATV